LRINLLAALSSSGTPVFEEVLVERCSVSKYKLLQSPGLVLGIAAGDIFEATGEGEFRVLERGQNLCVQIFCTRQLEAIEEVATQKFAGLSGRLDGKASKELVYTIPVTAGFPAVEAVARELVTQFPEAEWYFGNVYDPADGSTPLNWWI
jgi:Domain of unknown function (DUF4265)